MRAIQVRVTTNDSAQTVMLTDESTPRDAFEQVCAVTDGALIYIDGAQVQPGDINKTFAQLNAGDTVTLSAIVKVNNA